MEYKSATITVSELSANYSTNKVNTSTSVLKNINFEIYTGQVLGLFGPNGSGKSTLIRILSGLLIPSSGNVAVLENIPHKQTKDFRRQISLYLGCQSQLWWDMPATAMYNFLGAIYKIPRDVVRMHYKYYSERFLISGLINKPVKECSVGERAKLGLVAAFLHSPKVILFDEPMIGLDFQARKIFCRVCKEYVKTRQSVAVIASHHISEVEKICDVTLQLPEGNFKNREFVGLFPEIGQENPAKRYQNDR